MFLESANQSSVEVIFTIVSATVAVVSLLVSIVLFFLSRRSYHEERLTNKFGDAYRKSFAIREEIGKSNSRLLNNQNFILSLIIFLITKPFNLEYWTILRI